MRKQNKLEKTPRRKNLKAQFLIIFLLIIIISGGTFYFGWVQFSLDAGEYGVIYTKTSGWDHEIVRNGEFSWRWEALLPTNLTLHILKSTMQTIEIKKTGSLPSGKLFSKLAGEGAEFDWKIHARVNYRIIPETIPTLVSEGLVVDSLEDLYPEYESRIERELIQFVNAKIISLDIDAVEKQLKTYLNTIDDKMGVINVSIVNWYFPDKDLYDETKRLMLKHIKERQAVLAEIEDARLRRDDNLDETLSRMSRYGEVLTAHPILLDYFSIQNNLESFFDPSQELIPVIPERSDE